MRMQTHEPIWLKMGTPYKRAPDSPSRQLLWELHMIAITAQDSFTTRLRREEKEREALHNEALAAAAAKHERVRREAEMEQQQMEEKIEAQRRQREEVLRRELEEQRYQKELAERQLEAARQQAAAEHQKQLAAAEKAAQDARDHQAAEQARIVAVEAKKREAEAAAAEEQQRRQDEEAVAAKAKQEAATALQAKTKQNALLALQKAKAQSAGVQIEASRTATRSGAANISSGCKARHARYIQIHQELKQLRKTMSAKFKEAPNLKVAVNDMRRAITKSVGQLNGDNRKVPVSLSVPVVRHDEPLTPHEQLNTVLQTLRKGQQISEPKVDIRTFLYEPPDPPPADPNVPAVLIYLLNIFTKAVISQFINEAGGKPEAADPIGIVASHIFALPDFRWDNRPLIDILICKFHIVGPALFGIYGPEDTAEGKSQLGWRHDLDGSFIPSQGHYTRMTGLAAGFAALSLRNFEKVKVENPFPENNYWDAFAGIVSLAPHQITPTHFVLLQALIVNYETKFIGFFGGAAIAASRVAILELPRGSPQSIPAKSLAGLVGKLMKERNLIL